MNALKCQQKCVTLLLKYKKLLRIWRYFPWIIIKNTHWYSYYLSDSDILVDSNSFNASDLGKSCVHRYSTFVCDLSNVQFDCILDLCFVASILKMLKLVTRFRGLMVANVGFELRVRCWNPTVCQITDDGRSSTLYHSLKGGLLLDKRCIAHEFSFILIAA